MSEVVVQLNTRQGTHLTALPAAVMRDATWVLSESGHASFDIDPRADGANKIKLWDTEIEIWWDGVLRFNGPCVSFGGNPQVITVQAEEVLSWMKKRFVDRMSLIYGDPGSPAIPANPTAHPPIAAQAAVPASLIDQFTIAWDLVAYAQDESIQGNRNFRLDAAAFGSSGVGRSANYKRQEHACLYDLLQDFRKFYQGIDFEVIYPGDGHRFFKPWYPMKGVFRPQYKMIYNDTGARNIASFQWQADGLAMVTHDYSTGGTVQGQKIEENYEDVGASSRHGVLQAITSQGSQLDRTWLQAQARGLVDDRKEPIVTFSAVSVTTQDINMFGTLQTGDWIPIQIDWGMIQEDDKRRVQSITWNPNDSLTLQLGEVVP